MSLRALVFSLFFVAFASKAGAAAGDLDATFDLRFDGPTTGVAQMADGIVVIGGLFDNVEMVPRGNIVRVDPEGTLDGTVLPATNGNSNCITVMEDGGIVLGGSFNTVGGFTRRRLVRLTAAGGVDATFNPNLNDGVYSAAIQGDGKLIVVGAFTTAGGSTRNRALRLNGDGSLDSFNPNANDFVRSVAVLPDGRVMLGGNFTSMGGMARQHLARLTPAGTLDPAFTAPVNGNVYCVALQPDGRMLIGGNFTNAGGALHTNIARLDASGIPDPGFTTSINNIVRSISLQVDGKMVVSGNFTEVNDDPCGGLVRLNADGTIDPTFRTTGTNGLVNGISLDSRGQITAVGDFTASGSTPRSNLARFENEPAFQALTIRGNDRVVWKRTGTSPETQRVTYELSAGNGMWTPLGTGTRISDGWELPGLNLAEGAIVRARARVVCGIYNGCSSLMEATTLSSRENWRLIHFDSAVNGGDAEDTADPDKDGLVNLVEFAFGLNPLVPDGTQLPEWERADGELALHFVQPPGVNGVEYFAQYNTSLEPGGWLPLPNTTGNREFTFHAPSDSPARIFLRFGVRLP
ncbi:MAG TPA: delta-60 repeat domain-containing protein [Verrucomicrobiales bacterium]|nr:delta-60 repeat domain-containing protein [Verrucomicrobiales bacterium]